MLKAVLIDDETDAINSLKIILTEYCPNVEVVGVAQSAIEGIKEINSKKPEIVFLDVEMPHGNGFDVLDGIAEKRFKVVFTTAYNHYAVKAIKYNAIDYLLKPLDIDEVIEAVKKIEKSTENYEEANKKYSALLDGLKKNTPKRVSLPTNEGIEFFFINDVIKAEADGSYTKIFLLDKKIIFVSKILKDIEDIFNDNKFFRAHNSFLINIDFIIKYLNKDGGYIEMSDGSLVPLSRRKKAEFFEKLKLGLKE